MNKYIVRISALVAALAAPLMMNAQQTLTLEQCREMAIENNKTLKQAETKIEMSGYDRKIAFANYLPNISATGAYVYNASDIALVSDEASQTLQNMGTMIHSQAQNFTQNLMAAITSNPSAAAEYMKSPMWQMVLGALSQTDLSQTINALGKEIDDAFHPDLHNIFAGSVSLQQPVFMGGKIIAANKIAKLAEQLSKTQYDQQYQQVVVDVDQAYWQIVSIANKKKLADAYADLLHKMENDVNLSVKEGVATESDALQIKVKANEADMLKTKSDNGLTLAKMLLCKQIGLDLNSDITLADEDLDVIPVPQMTADKDLDQIYSDRPETRSLELASRIYDGKVRVARADMMPKVALMAGYSVTNPNLRNGFQKDWGGFFNAGVMVNIPIFHGFEAMSKTRKAKAEATLYRTQLEEAKNLINLQVTQLRKQENEAFEKLTMARNNLASAEENLRTATVGFEEGVIETNTTLAAQTAWLKANSEYIDAGIELQMLAANLNKAEGSIKAE
jgi:outer membrane protein TolC